MRSTQPLGIKRQGGPAMRTMSDDEIDQFVSTTGSGVLSLADASRAYGIPLFYGGRRDAIYFQTRAGRKTHYLYATSEACLTISRSIGQGRWASVQLFGRLERVDPDEIVAEVLQRVAPPLDWAEDDVRAGQAHDRELTTFRLAPQRRIGRYSEEDARVEGESEAGLIGM